MSSVRTFLAIPVDNELKSRIAELQSGWKKQLPEVRWTRADNLHLTLHFFGDVTHEILEKIKVSVLSVKGCQDPFQVDVQGLGAFPSLKRSRVLWLGLTPQDPLQRLHRYIQGALQEIDIPMEKRAFAPHLTIGRTRRGTTDLAKTGVTLSDTTIGHLDVDRLILFESQLLPGGAQHTPIIEVPLK